MHKAWAAKETQEFSFCHVGLGTGVFLAAQGDEAINSKQAICRGPTGWKQDQPE